MSHREHVPGVAERGNDWLDGALAGWLLFIAINGGNLAWHSLREGAAWSTSAMNLAVPVLSVAAIFPLLRFHRIGWGLAILALGLMATREGMMLAASEGAWRATVAFLVVDLLGIAYLLWIIPEFWPRHPAEPVAASAKPAPANAVVPAESVQSAGLAASTASASSAQPAESAEPTPVMRALAAIHHRIVAAGSACAVTEVAVRAEAGRFGVTPAALRTEGLSLYRTFLRYFMTDGALSAEEERELICLERALDLDDDGVWKLRAEAGLVGGLASAAPPLRTASEPALPAALAPSAPVDADRSISADGHRAIPVDADLPVPVDDSPPASVDDSRVISVDADRPVSVDTDRSLSVDDDRRAPVDDRRANSVDADWLTAVDAHSRVSSDADRPIPVDATRDAAPPRAGIDVPSSAARTTEPAIDEPPVPRFQSPGPDARDSAAAQPVHEIPAASADPSETLADYEEHELGATLAWAGIGALPAGAPRRTALERLRALYRTATEPLEPCVTDVALDPAESCLAQRDVQVYVAAAGAAPPPPDLPGPLLSRRALVDGSLDRDADLSALQRRGACRFVLTERRLLLVTPAGQRSELAVSRVRAVHPHRNGIEVRQQRGAPVFLAFTDGVDDAAMRMDRAAADLRARA